MERIGIADFEKLVMERLENPSLFENKTLVLWQQRCYPGNLPEFIIMKCCIRFNELFPSNQAWYKRYSGFTFMKENYTELEVCPPIELLHGPLEGMYGFKHHGILLNDGGYWSSNDKDDWLRFVNTHYNSVGPLSLNWPMIAYANNSGLEEDNFEDSCTLCKFQPGIDEWYEWLKPIYPADILNPIVDYMRTKGLSTDSHAWEIILNELTGARGGVGPLNKLTRDEYEFALGGHRHHFPDSLIDDLWSFIHKGCE